MREVIVYCPKYKYATRRGLIAFGLDRLDAIRALQRVEAMSHE